MSKKFKKTERLKSKSLIEEVFKKKNALFFSSFRILYLKQNSSNLSKAKIMISIPKKKIKKATHRNYIKRLIFNSYRENKNLLLKSENPSNYSIIFIFSGGEIPTFSQINTSVKKAISTLIEIKTS